MKEVSKKKMVKQVKVDVDKCTGCRSCEMACSAFHAVPKYSSLNPARARIRVFVDELRDLYIPIRAGDFTQAECMGRTTYTIEGKEYEECAFCRASCPSRDYFKDPDTGLPIKCDMCEADPPLSEPMCVQACKFDALTYEEREAEGTEEVGRDEMDIRLESLTSKYGLQKLVDAVVRLSEKG